MQLKVLWLTDGINGHQNKVRGILHALSALHELNIDQRPVDWRYPAARLILCRLGVWGLKIPASLFLKENTFEKNYDLIISSGGHTQWPNAVLSRLNGVPNAFVGSVRQFPHSTFRLVLKPDPGHEKPPFLRVELIPSIFSPDAVTSAAREYFPHHTAPAWSVLIGGDGEGYIWKKKDWEKLGRFLISTAQKHKRMLYVATSRRTPLVAEQLLQSMLEQAGVVAGADWFQQRTTPPVPLAALLGAGEKILVTADSVSMTHEAISSGRPVISVQPAPNPRNRRLKKLNARQAELGRLVEYVLGSDFDIDRLSPVGGWKPITYDPTRRLAEKISRRLGFEVSAELKAAG